MSSQLAEITYPYQDQLPLPGQKMEVAEGVYWLRMPLPFALDHINLWLLADEIEGQRGWTVVDTGVNRPEVKDLWEQIFSTQLEGLPILRVLVTHMHPDHVGLAGWLCEHWQVPLWMSLSDYALACLWSKRNADNNQEAADEMAAASHFARHGLIDKEIQEKINLRSNYYADLVSSPPTSYRRLMDGLVITIGGREWRCIVGYGHAPEHIALYCESLEVLISGDMVLPTISSNVSVFSSEPEANPLTLYLQSLQCYFSLPADTLILPSHGRPFRGLHGRIQDLVDHHDDRLAETLAACAQPTGCNAAELVPILFKRKLDIHQLTFAMGEAIAHLHALYFDQRLTRSLNEQNIYTFYTVTQGE